MREIGSTSPAGGHIWPALVERMHECAHVSEPKSIPWEPDSGESPWQWADRASIPEIARLEAFAKTVGVEFHRDLSAYPPAPSFLSTYPIAYARRHFILGLK